MCPSLPYSPLPSTVPRAYAGFPSIKESHNQSPTTSAPCTHPRRSFSCALSPTVVMPAILSLTQTTPQPEHVFWCASHHNLNLSSPPERRSISSSTFQLDLESRGPSSLLGIVEPCLAYILSVLHCTLYNFKFLMMAA